MSTQKSPILGRRPKIETKNHKYKLSDNTLNMSDNYLPSVEETREKFYEKYSDIEDKPVPDRLQTFWTQIIAQLENVGHACVPYSIPYQVSYAFSTNLAVQEIAPVIKKIVNQEYKINITFNRTQNNDMFILILNVGLY